MERLLKMARAGAAGIGMGVLYSAVNSSFSSIRRSSLASKEVRSFNTKYPYVQCHSDLNYVIQELLHFSPYADVHPLIELCNELMKKYITFGNMDKTVANARVLIQTPKQIHDLGHDIKEEAECLQTALIEARPSNADEIINHVQAIQKTVDDVLFNVMMDVDISI